MKKGKHKGIGTTSFVLLSLFIAVLCFSWTADSAPLPDVEPLQKIQKKKVVLTYPGRVEVGSDGMLYVIDGGQNRILKLDRKGNYVTYVLVTAPSALGVSPGGTLYIGSSNEKSVAIHDGESITGYLGAGANEFMVVRDITVDSNSGEVYVADTIGNAVKVYDPSGNKIREITNLEKPAGVAVSGTEVYILDAPEVTDPTSTGSVTSGARVSVYDTNGTFLRSFSDSLAEGGNMKGQKDITVDDNGTIYIADSFQNMVFAYDSTGTYLGEVVHPTEQMNAAVSLASAPDGRLYVSSSQTNSVLAFGMNGYTYLEAAPLSLSYTAQAGGSNPASQITTVSNSGSGDLTYTTSSSKTWIQTDQPSGAVAAQSSMDMNVSVDAAGIATGQYSGELTITDDSGASEVVTVSLEVLPPPSLSVLPSSLTFDTVCGSGNPPSQTATIQIDNDVNGSVNWTADASQTWLGISPASGTGGALTQASVSVDMSGLPGGPNSGQITVTAPGADNSPANIDVTLNVNLMGALDVSNTIDQASFTIDGPNSVLRTAPIRSPMTQ